MLPFNMTNQKKKKQSKKRLHFFYIEHRVHIIKKKKLK